MSSSNISQIIQRNLSLFNAQHLLCVNLDYDSVLGLYQQKTAKQLSSLNFHFGEYQQIQQQLPEVSSHFTAHYQAEQLHDVVVLRFPKTKQELSFTLAMLTSALADNAQIIIVGENNAGIKSAPKYCQPFVEQLIKQDSARHCTLFVGTFNNQRKRFNITDWFQQFTITVANKAVTLATLPGVFSQKKLDVGTRVLLPYLPKNQQGNALDFGCGCGVLGIGLLVQNPQLQVTFVDVNALALASTEHSLLLNQLTGTVIPSDSSTHLTGQYHWVVTNPPFHQGVKTNYEATETFLLNIARFMPPTAKLLLVANSFLNYQQIMEKAIGRVKQLTTTAGFSVYEVMR
jgi:16S rRNA (guanine1207-N2)-methyltransferase